MAGHLFDKNLDQTTFNVKTIKVFTLIIVVCLAFAGGFFVRGNDALLERLGFDQSSGADLVNPGATVSGSTYDSISARVAEMQGVLDDESMDSYDLSSTTQNVLGSFTESTEDPYLRYYDANRYATYIKDTSDTYAGIGVLFNEYEGRSYAVDVFTGSEAAAKDVQVGDFILAIDGDRGTEGWSQVETVKALSRAEGEPVVITWRRPASLEADGGTEFTTTLACSQYTEPNVTTDIIDDRVGYIRLTQITQNSAALMSSALDDVSARGAQSIVLDLRDNPGGYLTQSLDIAGLFVKSGVGVQVKTRESTTSKTLSGTQKTELPMVVLINGNTSAAAEVLVAALQDNNRASLIGTHTMGKGTVQSIRELSFGGALRYTSAEYLTPQGYSFNGTGVSPNVVVERGDDPAVDNQRNIAVETALALIPS